MDGLVNYIPIATTAFSLYFFILLYKHWSRNKSSTYIFWWMLGVFFYGLGTITESVHTLFGFSVLNFKAWYIFGAFLGGAPLAQGTVHLLMKRKTARLLSITLTAVIVICSIIVIASPLLPGPHPRLDGKTTLGWQFIRYLTIPINLYAVVFLIGGAIYSAVKYAENGDYKHRFWGNVFIAIGGLLPGIGGSSAKAGHVEVLFVTEFVGLCFIYLGYYIIKNSKEESLHNNQSLATA